jgi:hypothetical protein
MRTEGYIQVRCREVVKSGRGVEKAAEQEKVVMLWMNGMRRWMRMAIRAFLIVSVCAQEVRRSLTISIRIISFQFCNIFLARFTLGILSQNLPLAPSQTAMYEDVP